jgi:hypothetical protein
VKRLFLTLVLLPVCVAAQDLATLSRNYGKSPTTANREALLAYAAKNKDVTGGLALLAIGAQDVAGGRHAAALPHLRAALDRVPQLADLTSHLIAAASLQTQDFAGAVRAAEAVLPFVPKSPMRGPAALAAATAHVQLKAPDRAIAMLEAVYDDVAKPAANLLLGAAYESAGDAKKAAEYYQRTWLEHPTSTEAKDAESALARVRQQLGKAYSGSAGDGAAGSCDQVDECPRICPGTRRVQRTRHSAAERSATWPRYGSDWLNIVPATIRLRWATSRGWRWRTPRRTLNVCFTRLRRPPAEPLGRNGRRGRGTRATAPEVRLEGAGAGSRGRRVLVSESNGRSGTVLSGVLRTVPQLSSRRLCANGAPA